MDKLKLTAGQIMSSLDGMAHYEGMQYIESCDKSDKAKTPRDKKFYFEESERHFLRRRSIQFFEKELVTILDMIIEYKTQDKIRHFCVGDTIK